MKTNKIHLTFAYTVSILIGTLHFISLSAETIYPTVNAQVKTVDGLPALCLDGKPVPPLLCVTADPNGSSIISNGTLFMHSNALYSSMFNSTKKDLPADCNIEAEVAFDSYSGSDASIGIAFMKGKGEITFNLAAYGKEKRLKFWDRNASGKGLIRWKDSFEWKKGVFHRLRMEVRGRKISIFIDEKHIATEECSADSKPGPLKTGMYRGEGRFRLIRVTHPDGTVFMEENFSDPTLPLWNARAGSDCNLITGAAASGIHICQVGMALPEFWKEPDEFDLTLFSERMQSALQADPETHVIMRLRLLPPGFWTREHPGELVQGKYLDGRDMSPHQWANFASPIWRKNLQRVLSELVKQIDNHPWAGRMIGFQVMAANGGEWVYSFDRSSFHDYSPAQQREFRLWLKEKYGTDANLKKAWGKTAVTIDNAIIPPPTERIHQSLWSQIPAPPPPYPKHLRSSRIFINPTRDQDLLDYKTFHNRAVTETILLTAKALKASPKQKRVIGIYYGYHVPTTSSITNKGHSDLAHLLASPLIDILACPLNYDQRDTGGTTLPQLAPASVRANGKLFWIEDDSRTVYSREGIQWRIPSLPETEEVIKRTFAYALTKGGGDWWLDFGNHWFGHPPILKLFKQFSNTMQSATPAERTSNAQIVVLLQDQSYLRLLHNSEFNETTVYRQLLEECSRIGTSFDIAMLSDIERLPPYKLYIMPDAFYVSDREKAMLHRVLRCKERTSLWIYAPGLWTSEGLSSEAASELTGIRLKQSRCNAKPDLRLTSSESLWIKGLPPTFHHLSAARLDPVIYVDDPAATELGQMVMRFPQSPGGYRTGVQPRVTGLAVREFDSWNSIYCAIPSVPTALLRSIAKEAGVHLYGDGGDTIYASQGFLAIHTGSAGKKTLHLPKGVQELHEIFNDSRIPVTNGIVQVDLTFGQTRLWKLNQAAPEPN